MKKLLLFTQLFFALCQFTLLAQHPVQEITRIPFRLENGELIIDVQIADNVFPMVVDTKSKGLYLYRWAQTQAGLKMKYKPGYEGGRDSLILGQTRMERIDIGAVHFNPGRVKVYKNSSWFKMRGKPVAGVIGSDLFKRYIVHFDFEELQILLYDPGTFEAGDRFKTGKIEISRGSALVAADFVFPGARLKNEWVMLSTGFGGAICIKHKAAKKYGLFDAGVRQKALRSFEWPGHVFPASLSYAASVSVMNKNFESVPVLAARSDKTFAAEHPFDDIMIGNEILQRFNFTIDYPNKRIYYRSNGNINKEFTVRRSGLIISRNPQSGIFFIEKVYPGSPAWKGGVRAGDEIISIYYQPVDSFSLDKLRTLLNRSAKKVELLVRRDGKYHRLSFRNPQ